MSSSWTLVFHARPAAIFLGDVAFQVLLSLAVLVGQRNTRSARLLAGVFMSRPRSVGRMVTFVLRKTPTCSAWRHVVKLNSLEEGRRIRWKRDVVLQVGHFTQLPPHIGNLFGRRLKNFPNLIVVQS
jgi:hypothetical protein